MTDQERLEELKPIKLFIDLIDKKEIIYRDGKLYRWLKLTRKYKSLGRLNSGGYKQLTKTIDGVEFNALEHRIIYCYFNGMDDFPSHMTINHINGIKTDNRIENLEMVSQSENLKHAYETNLRKAKKGRFNPSSKLTEKDVEEIISFLENGEKRVKELSLMYGVSTTVIYKIKSNESWRHVSRTVLEKTE